MFCLSKIPALHFLSALDLGAEAGPITTIPGKNEVDRHHLLFSPFHFDINITTDAYSRRYWHFVLFEGLKHVPRRTRHCYEDVSPNQRATAIRTSKDAGMVQRLGKFQVVPPRTGR